MKADSNVIRDRRYHLRHYTSCFVGCECIEWLIHKGEAPNRSSALAAMQLLVDHHIIHHVCDDHSFKDEYLFYRFRRDDNTFIDTKESKVLSRGLTLYNRLHGGDTTILMDREENGHIYPESFCGEDLVTWMVEHWDRKKRRADLEGECRELLEFNIIKHVTDDHHFKDSRLLYQFKQDIHKKRSLVGLLLTKAGRTDAGRPHHDSNSSSGSAHSLRKISVGSTCSSSSETSLSVMFPMDCDDEGELSASEYATSASPKSVIVRKVTADELEDPESPFVKKNICIAADAVGFGFVVRGGNPAYVQTVDPTGPAASAGLKVRHFIYSVNGQVVLRKTHREVAGLVRNSPERLSLTVMMHFREASMEKEQSL